MKNNNGKWRKMKERKMIMKIMKWIIIMKMNNNE